MAVEVDKFVAALLITLTIACGGRAAEPIMYGPDVLEVTGTVRFFSQEGGFFAIQGDDAKTYDPINLDVKYQKEGLRVRFTARLRPDMVGVRMVGPIIEILQIESIGM